MVKVEQFDKKFTEISPDIIKNLKGKRKLTGEEIEILIKNQNVNESTDWDNIYVDENCFDPELISQNHFSGTVILGKIAKVKLSYNDLHLSCGIINSTLNNVILGDYGVVYNVSYLENYHIGDRVILFNVQEICCTRHSKFGNGILKQGEPESHRTWIGIANENDGRRVLAFENIIPADAYIWSHYRDDPALLKRFIDLTEYGNSGRLDTYGIIEDDVVIKNTNIVKDSKICKSTYIKGAFKLKNITILSSEEEPSQVGEGVEMINGILGFGSRIFYQAIAVRFVIGRNCQIKYGARLLNSVLGDNSTVSCCEILNNLIFPFHEQHHNSSFLIATTVMGQSNIAAGATIGSNHNSRSPDGEIIAKRGFWPGLCSDFKHNSRFASFVLVAKGSYQFELDISYPFSLVTPGVNGDCSVHVIPAWWFMYDMFAIMRNKNKFTKRDKRFVKVQNIETDPLAPDTMQEILSSITRIISLTAEYLEKNGCETMKGLASQEEKLQAAKDYLHHNEKADFTLKDSTCQKKYGGVVYKPVKAYKMYRKIVKYFAARTLMEYCASLNQKKLSQKLIDRIQELPLYTEWENIGGQIIPTDKVMELFDNIKKGSINNWEEVHQYYNLCESCYSQYKVRYALYLLEWLYSRPVEQFTPKLYRNIIEDVTIVSNNIYTASVQSREKDYTDYYRNMTYRSSDEMEAVIGSLNDNTFLIQLKADTEYFNKEISQMFEDLID